LTRSSSHQIARFLVVGAVNTGLSYLVYLALLRWVSYRWAYSISYATGIVLSFVLNSRFVFRVPLRWRRLLPYPSVYLVQYLLGLCVVYVGVELLRWDERLMPVAVLVVTVPVSFVLTRWVLSGADRGDEGGPFVPPG
jgi:putative flippase GtrA